MQLLVNQLKCALSLVLALSLLACGIDKPGSQPKKSPSDLEEKLDQKDDVVTGMYGDKPDFESILDVKQKKQLFFDYMYDFVENVNKEVVHRKLKIAEIAAKSPELITRNEQAFIEEMAEMYLRDHDTSDIQASAKYLLPYVDVIPPSLALAQAANESGWGTSRFATEANNYYGQWCFKKGCGLVPSQRDNGTKHEVRKFRSAEGSVRSYIRNINTHFAYKDLRNIREKLRRKGKFLSGRELAKGLSRYSERGDEYVKEIQSLIRVNKLDKYDQKLRDELNING